MTLKSNSKATLRKRKDLKIFVIVHGKRDFPKLCLVLNYFLLLSLYEYFKNNISQLRRSIFVFHFTLRETVKQEDHK